MFESAGKVAGCRWGLEAGWGETDTNTSTDASKIGLIQTTSGAGCRVCRLVLTVDACRWRMWVDAMRVVCGRDGGMDV